MSNRNLVWGAIIVLIALMFYCLTPMVAQQDAVHTAYAPLIEVDALVRSRFVEALDQDRLVDGAIAGMMLQLDPYSRYIPPDEMGAFERRTSPSFIGIGVEIGMRHRQVTVIAPIEESPAARAGILAGDTIVAVDGQPTKGLSVLDVDHLLTGSPGSSVSLIVKHQADEEVETVEVVRGPVSVRSVKGVRKTPSGDWDYLIDPERPIGYVRVSRFRENTTVDFDGALSTLRGLGVRGLILDLRFNGGGLLPRAVEMVDRFLDSGVIVSTVNRKQVVNRYRAKHEGTVRGVELVVLVNGGSASASEIVAGALQAHDRAIVLGTRSFGKGSIQHVIYLKERDAALQLTLAHYELPNGRIIHRTDRNADTDEWGIIPDVEVPLSDEELLRIQRTRNLADAGRPPDQVGRSIATQASTTETATAPAGYPPVWIDPQIQRALELLAKRVERRSRTDEPAGRGEQDP